MIRIGIVGRIGSGKSYISKQFGYPVFNADIEVNKIYKRSNKCFKKLKNKIPNYVFSFPVRKKEIINAILAKKNNLKIITKIIHPQIRINLNKFIVKNKDKKVVILDIPLLMENKIREKKDILIFVEANSKEINKRLKKRPNFSLKIIKQFKNLQISPEIKKKHADFIIKNNFKHNSSKNSVKKIMKKILLNA